MASGEFLTGDFWKHFFGNARALRVTGSRLQLVLFAAMAMGGMVLGVNPVAAICFVVVLHLLEPIRSCVSFHLQRTQGARAVVQGRNKLQVEVSSHRRRLRLDEPELPLKDPVDNKTEEGPL